MKKAVYFECSSGISGDMTVAALLDLGADRQAVMTALESIPDKGFSFEIGRVKKAGIDCCDFNVKLEHDNHDHDMEYLHGHEHHHHDHEHGHYHEHSHEHEHSHSHGHEHHHHEHRGMQEIRGILNKCDMTSRAREYALKIFGILAEAEAKAHDSDIDHVHFHEVGALDSIADIAAVSVCMDSLGIDEVIIPRLCEGSGTVRCQHGILPVPVPATANIAAAHGLSLSITNTQGELVTPTGAAIAAAFKTSDRLPEKFRIVKTGLGAGKRNYDRPSILRVMLIEYGEGEKDAVCKLESNIDDCTGENLGYVMERLLEAGARDVHYTPVFMKKNRPAYQLNVICSEADTERLEDIIFRETTTIGIRRIRLERTVLEREERIFDTPYGTARVKVCRVDGEERFYPEYESAAAISRNHGITYAESCALIISCCKK